MAAIRVLSGEFFDEETQKEETGDKGVVDPKDVVAEVGQDAAHTPANAFHFVLLFLGAAVPIPFLIAIFSDIGIGIQIHSTAMDGQWNTRGNAIILGGVAVAVLAYFLDALKWALPFKAVTVLVVIYMWLVGFIMKCHFYPYAPVVIILSHVLVFLGLLRMTLVSGLKRRSFYILAATATMVTAFAILTGWMCWMFAGQRSHSWSEATSDDLAARSQQMYDLSIITANKVTRPLNYNWDCKQKKLTDYTPAGNSTSRLSREEINARELACGDLKTIWFLVWITPGLCTALEFAVSVFFWLNVCVLHHDDMEKLQQALKRFLYLIVALVLCLWLSISVAGASMRLTGTLVAFCGAGLLGLFVWLVSAVGREQLLKTVRMSKGFKMLLDYAASDWVKAFFVLGFNVLLPILFVLDMVHQKVRQCRFKATPSGWNTEEATGVLTTIRRWNWTSIFFKTNALVELYWCLTIGIAKVSYVFLSWFNEALQGFDLVSINVIFFFVGLALFWLPPMPGLPVYITCGLVNAARARTIQAIGFWGGAGIACVVATLIKLGAAVTLWGLGIWMSKSPSVLNICGVTTLPSLAMEKIMNTGGYNLRKTAMLLGAPDWPIHVMSGVWRCSVLECTICCLPCVVFTVPSTLAGAFYATPQSGTDVDGPWGTLATVCLAVGALATLAFGLLAANYIQEVVLTDDPSLTAKRPEYEAVYELVEKEEAYNNAYTEVSQFAKLSWCKIFSLVISTALLILAFFVFMFADAACFRAFQVNGKIGDPFEDEGLNGNVFNLVQPLGWATLGIFFTGVLIHTFIGQILSYDALRALAAEPEKFAAQKPDQEAKVEQPVSSKPKLPSQARSSTSTWSVPQGEDQRDMRPPSRLSE